MTGHSVSILTSKQLAGTVQGGVNYTCVPESADVVIAMAEPKAAHYAPGQIRFVQIQHDNHWEPPPGGGFLEGIDKALLVGETLYQIWNQVYASERLGLMWNTVYNEFIPVDETQRNPNSLFFCAAPTPSSGILQALEAVALLDRADLEFHIYGDARLWYAEPVAEGIAFDKSMQAQIEQRVARIPGKVVFHGTLAWMEMAKEYTRHAILIHPKTHETFGCTVAEAQYAGCIPVVASVKALRERVSPWQNGLWARWDNPSDFATKIHWLFEHNEDRIRMQREAMRTAENYSTERMLRRWNHLLEAAEL
jgi:glycosyltransferase involved in cell wall biosynthesis